MGKDTNERIQPVKLYFTSCSTIENHFYERPPIILVPGLFSTNATWNRVKCQISNWTRRRVFSIDLRNHGMSGYSDQFDIKHMAADLELMMKEQNIRKAILVGHSCGGRIVMELALQKPELVEKLVAEDIIISDKHLDKRESLLTMCKNIYKYISQLPPTMQEADAHKLINSILTKFLPQFSTNGKMFQDIGKSLPFYKCERTGEFKFTCNMPALIDFLENPSRSCLDLTSDPVYPGKTLFISGEHTLFNMEEEQELALKYFPNALFETVKGSIHASHTESPEEFARKVVDFIVAKED